MARCGSDGSCLSTTATEHKDHLFPETGEDTYVVADTQFAQERWIDDKPIDSGVKSTLAPFNHVRVGSGYPDLVGVRRLDNDLLAVDRLDEANVAYVTAPAGSITQHARTLAGELNVRGDDDVRERALTGDGALRPSVLADGTAYHSPTVFQLILPAITSWKYSALRGAEILQGIIAGSIKAMLYHAGILTERGTEPSNLDPSNDEWCLREPLSARSL